MRMVCAEAAAEASRETVLRRPDGVGLAMSCLGAGQAPTLLFTHGFGQTRQAWTGAARALASAGLRCVSFDARGHGASDWLPGGGYHLDQFVEDLRAVAQAQPQPPILVGASMGGLLGLALAGESDPPPFAALVLVDITPRWRPEGVARILDFMRAHPRGFADYQEAADAIAAYLPHRDGRKSPRQLEPLLREGADGRLRWHWDPALLGAVAEEGERYQPRLLEAARRVDIPVLLVSGGRSDVVSEDTVNEFLELVPHARHVELPAATHMVAGDANDAFTDTIHDFVRTLAPSSSAVSPR